MTNDVSAQTYDAITHVVNVSSMVLEVVYIYFNCMYVRRYETPSLAESALTFIYRCRTVSAMTAEQGLLYIVTSRFI